MLKQRGVLDSFIADDVATYLFDFGDISLDDGKSREDVLKEVEDIMFELTYAARKSKKNDVDDETVLRYKTEMNTLQNIEKGTVNPRTVNMGGYRIEYSDLSSGGKGFIAAKNGLVDEYATYDDMYNSMDIFRK